MSAKTPAYDAIITDVRMSDYGYWVVKFSAEPGLDMSVMICQTGVTRDEAALLAAATLTSQTSRKVAM